MSKYDYKTFRLKITVLTPLHIGNGREMLRNYDFDEKQDKIWRFDENTLLDMQEHIEDPKIIEHLARAKPVELVEDKEYRDSSPLFRYHIPGTVLSSNGNVSEFIKTVYDQPYLPGSSLKGALRTALGWGEWERKKLHPALDKVSKPHHHSSDKRKYDKKRAANRYEQEIFFPNAPQGKGPNYDLMRALHVSDSQPLDPGRMAVVNVAVYRNWYREKIDRISSLEILPAGTELDGTIVKIEAYLFGVDEKSAQWQTGQISKLRFDRECLLTRWVQVCQRYARQRIETEMQYYISQAKGSGKIANALNLYRRWQSLQPGDNEPAFLLQLGWGTGWDGKTFGSRLKADDEFMLEVIEGCRLGGKHKDYKHSDEFPMSRRLLYKKHDAPLGYPLGWVLINVAEEGAEFVETDWQKMIKGSLDTGKTHPTALFYSADRQQPIAPAPKPLISEFMDIPQIDDRFEGIVFGDEGGLVMLEIPGLNADEQAYAVILREKNPLLGRKKDGEKIICKVLNVKEEQKNYWRVECQLG